MNGKQLTAAAIMQSIEPKSDQMNAVDLLTGPQDVVISGALQGPRDQPVILQITGKDKTPFKPCKTVVRLLVAIWGNDPLQWIGRSMRLFCDPNVTYGGMKTGGIRVSHVSDIEHPVELTLLVSRNKYQTFNIEPLPKPETKKAKEAMTLAERVEAAKEAYAAAKNVKRLATLDKHIDALAKECDEDQKKELHAVRDAAIERLETAT